jgi:hypothetical protein
MKKHHLYISSLFFWVTMLASCASNAHKKIQIREFAFNDSGLKVISSLINDKTGTISTLYGNESALSHSINKNNGPAANEVFKLVTFEQQDPPFWYGSKINGALLQVETVKTVQRGAAIIPEYVIEYYGANSTAHHPADTLARIQFILDQQAAFFP